MFHVTIPTNPVAVSMHSTYEMLCEWNWLVACLRNDEMAARLRNTVFMMLNDGSVPQSKLVVKALQSTRSGPPYNDHAFKRRWLISTRHIFSSRFMALGKDYFSYCGRCLPCVQGHTRVEFFGYHKIYSIVNINQYKNAAVGSGRGIQLLCKLPKNQFWDLPRTVNCPVNCNDYPPVPHRRLYVS